MLVEDKGLTVSVHFRHAAAEDIPEIERIVRMLIAPHASVFHFAMGKMLVEILPRTGWDKGVAVWWINCCVGKAGALPIYLGDDRTDEDAFRALPEGVTVKVGNGAETHAKYRVADPADVHEFLIWLARERTNAARSDDERP